VIWVNTNLWELLLLIYATTTKVPIVRVWINLNLHVWHTTIWTRNELETRNPVNTVCKRHSWVVVICRIDNNLELSHDFDFPCVNPLLWVFTLEM
jgi:hypothetical protein